MLEVIVRKEERGEREGGRVAKVLLAEAHVTEPVTFAHTDVVYHKQFDLHPVRARSSDGFERGAQVLDQLHTAAVTLLGWGQIACR